MAILSRCAHVITYPARGLQNIASSPSLMTGTLLSRLDLWNKGQKSTFFIWSLLPDPAASREILILMTQKSPLPLLPPPPHSPIRYKTNTIQLGYRTLLYVENYLIWYWSKDPYLPYQDPDPLSPPRREWQEVSERSPLILSTLERMQSYLASPVTFIWLTCAHLVKRVKLIYARLQGPGAAKADGLCVWRLGFFGFEIGEKFNLNSHSFHLWGKPEATWIKTRWTLRPKDNK